LIADGSEARKRFFLKEEAKTFPSETRQAAPAARLSKSFLVLFFKKELLSSILLLTYRGGAAGAGGGV
jgi:hypothetical protein